MRDVETRLGAGELAASCVCLLSALARGGELAGPGASLVSASFLDAALAERATRHAFRLAPNALLTPEVWSSLVARGVARTSPRWARRSSPFRAPPRRRVGARSDARAFSRARRRRTPRLATPADPAKKKRRRSPPRRRRSPSLSVSPSGPSGSSSASSAKPPTPRTRVWTPRRAASARTRASRPGRAGRAVAPRERAPADGGTSRRRRAPSARAPTRFTRARTRRRTTFDVRRATGTRARARAARRCSERALGAHAAYVAAALRRAREIGPKTRDAPREASRVGDSGSRGFRGGSETREPFSFSGTDGKQTGTVEATNATLLAHARFLTRVVADALAEDTTVRSYDRTLAEKAPAEAPRTEPPRTEPPELSSSDPREDPFEEEEEEEETTRLGLLRSARALVDALFASTETVEATVPSRRDELLAAATLVATRNLRAATGKTDSFFFPVNDENPADGLASVSPTETDTRSATPKRSRRGPRTPLVSAACAEAAASADGVGAGGVSAADALGYEF